MCTPLLPPLTPDLKKKNSLKSPTPQKVETLIFIPTSLTLNQSWQASGLWHFDLQMSELPSRSGFQPRVFRAPQHNRHPLPGSVPWSLTRGWGWLCGRTSMLVLGTLPTLQTAPGDSLMGTLCWGTMQNLQLTAGFTRQHPLP